MTLASSVFKAYDVRGVVPDELDAEGAYRIARAHVEVIAPRRIAIGHDMRLSSPELTAAAVEGALDAGCDVTRIGMVGTEMLYYAVAELGYDGGLTVTASHNPGRYNGMKIVRRGAQPVGIDSGLERIRAVAMAGAFATPPRRGEVDERSVLDGYTAKVMSIVDPATVPPLRAVLDGGNGMAGTMLGPILPRLALKPLACFMTPDGSFPDHEPNPLLEENRRFVVERVVSEKADCGIAWDGDGDRCFFVDGDGEFVPGDFITAILAEVILERYPGATILYDLRASRAVPDTVARLGGRAVQSRVGHAFIKQRMREEDAAFAGEVSGHYYFRDFYGVDTGIVPALMLLARLGQSAATLTQLVAPLRQRYFLSGEINSRVSDVAVKLQQLKDQFGGDGAAVSHLDGVSIEHPDWHFNVRPSNTEPLLRLNLEAFSQDEMERRRDQVLAVIRS